MKKIVFILIIVFITILIYTAYNEQKDLCLSINNNYIKDCNYSLTKEDLRINDIINNLDNNILIKDKYFKNILIKSNVIIIDSVTDEIKHKDRITYNYIDSYLKELDKLLFKIRNYSKEKIYVIGISNTFDYYYNEYYNQRLKIILFKHNIEYVDIINVNAEEISNNLKKQVDFY